MICQECQKRPATLHFKKVNNGETTEVHLCEICSQEKGELLMMNNHANLSIHNLLSGLLNINQNFTTHQQDSINDKEETRCKNCHLSYSEFVHIGKFGCSECYDSFSQQLDPIFKRLHSGNTVHIGKIPARIGGDLTLKKKIGDLKTKLQECVREERFEEAVTLRDRIRELEKEYNAPLKRGEER